MATLDIAVAGGELFECDPNDSKYCYFDPPQCPSDGASYGKAMAEWLNNNRDKAPAQGAACPFFGGLSADCKLAYDQLPAAAQAFHEAIDPAVWANLYGLGLWS